MNDSPARVRELLALYRRTHYDVAVAPDRTATLRVGLAMPPTIADWLGADRFAAYLTACNPRSRPLCDADNDARMDALRDRLHGAGARWLEGHAGIPGEAWREASVLVAGLGIGAVDRLARDFAQNAVLVAARDRRVALRLYRDEWRGGIDEAVDLEWATPG